MTWGFKGLEVTFVGAVEGRNPTDCQDQVPWLAAVVWARRFWVEWDFSGVGSGKDKS
jgi:hypothetical protein